VKWEHFSGMLRKLIDRMATPLDLPARLVLGVPLLLLSIGTCRLITELFAAAFLIAFAIACFQSKSAVNRLMWITWIVWLFSLFSPFDIALRRGDAFRVKMVKVVATNHSLVGVRKAKAAGLVENVDYVTYPCHFSRPFEKSALLISIPTSYNIRTPIIWNLFLKHED
jgi:hypothetical protein